MKPLTSSMKTQSIESLVASGLETEIAEVEIPKPLMTEGALAGSSEMAPGLVLEDRLPIKLVFPEVISVMLRSGGMGENDLEGLKGRMMSLETVILPVSILQNTSHASV